MPEWLVALVKIAAMFLVMLAGFLARRRGYFPRGTTTALVRFTADIALPALILGQLLQTLDRSALRAGWYLPLMALGIVGSALACGAVLRPLFAGLEQRRTWLFVVAISNWVYLPLPIAEALHGEQGRLAVLLYNVGGLAMLWTVGVWTLRGGAPGLGTVRELALNPGLWATLGGVALALLAPGLREAAEVAGVGRAAAATALVATQAVELLGSLTIPLSLLVIGAQLGTLTPRRSEVRPLLGVVLARLVVAPAVAVALLAAAIHAGWQPPPVTVQTVALISGMPVALTCSVLAERFGGDAQLAAGAVFVTTLASVVTVPLLLLLAGAAGL